MAWMHCCIAESPENPYGVCVTPGPLRQADGLVGLPFPGLYDPATAGELSPLFNAFEAAAVVPSDCPITDAFGAAFAPQAHATELFEELVGVCGQTDDPGQVRAALRGLSWALLDATLAAVPRQALTQSAHMAQRHAAKLTADHHQILQTIQNMAG
jgi:hypothetical protein